MTRSTAHEARNKAYRAALTDNATAKAAAIPTAQLIPKQAKELGVPWEVENVPSGQGGKIHWVGDRAATKVVLYFHGNHPLHWTFVSTNKPPKRSLTMARWRIWTSYISWQRYILRSKSTKAGNAGQECGCGISRVRYVRFCEISR